MPSSIKTRVEEPSRKLNARRRLGLVLTGGTVGSTLEYSVDGARMVSLAQNGSEALLSDVVGDPIHYRDLVIEQPIELLSEDLAPRDWEVIAQTVSKLAASPNLEGIVVLHGTDTLAYTAAALAFMLPEVSVPVVLTGSNKPPDQSQSDAGQNLHDAMTAASSLPGGVFISFSGRPGRPSKILCATRTRKHHASGAAFVSVNRSPLGRVHADGVEMFSEVERASPTITLHRADPGVLLTRVYPGMDTDRTWLALEGGGYKGIVIELYPSFTGPDRRSGESIVELAQRCGRSDIPVVAAVASMPNGRVSEYSSSRALRREGVVLTTMLPETALVKLMLALGSTSDVFAVRSLLREPLGGEFR